MSHNIHERIRNLSLVSSISLALLFFYFITKNFEFKLSIFRNFRKCLLNRHFLNC